MTKDSTYDYPRHQIAEVLSDIPEDIKSVYLPHIIEPERIEVARQLLLKEYYKLFPFMNAKQFEELGNSMVGWLDGRNQEMAPIHDFWNYLDGNLIGLKLKNIIPYLTSENIKWRHEFIDSKALTLYWPVGTLDKLNQPGPYDYEFVKRQILTDEKSLLENKQISDAKSSDTVLSRDSFPIVVAREISGELQLMDGNRRVMRAWIYDKLQISAWVGTLVAEPALHNYWLSTGQLRRLLAQYQADHNQQHRRALREHLKSLFANSEIAKINYRARCLSKPSGEEFARGTSLKWGTASLTLTKTHNFVIIITIRKYSLVGPSHRRLSSGSRHWTEETVCEL